VLVSEIGEFGLIRLLAQEFAIPYPPVKAASTRGLLVPLGDDAVVSQRRDAAVIWTTDTMVAGVHFLPGVTSWRDVGWKALAVNLSDIAAMGGTPNLALVTLVLPAEFRVEDAVELYKGLHEAATAYDVTLGGGDMVRGPTFCITVALSGLAYTPRLGEARVLSRGAARPGDVVAVSGTLGDSAGGVRLLSEGAPIKTKAQKLLRQAHERPQPRVTLGKAAVRASVRCGIDVSDGLVQDLGHIARASGVGIRVDGARVPVSDALREVFPSEALTLALSGGEDYEIVVIGARAAVEGLIGATDTPLTVIGEVEQSEEPFVVVEDEGRRIPLPRGGWDHFSGA
jgi:thiamine-monophosphate kinase